LAESIFEKVLKTGLFGTFFIEPSVTGYEKQVKTKDMKRLVFIALFGILFLTACNFHTKNKNDETSDDAVLFHDSTETTLDEMDETPIDDSGEAIIDDSINTGTNEPVDKVEQE
jgi:PBP1b-binding outer membrane lipoprotein LpoB